MVEDYNRILKEMIKYMKYLFDQSKNSMQMMFDHSDKIMNFIISQGDSVQEEAKNRFKEWLENAKKLRNDYIKMMGEQFEKIEEFFKTSRE